MYDWFKFLEWKHQVNKLVNSKEVNDLEISFCQIQMRFSHQFPQHDMREQNMSLELHCVHKQVKHRENQAKIKLYQTNDPFL